MAAKNKVINSTNKTHNTVGGASMDSKVMQTTSYDINNSHYEVVRIFDKSRDIKSLIEENISAKNKEVFN
jgi:hypothetical protein